MSEFDEATMRDWFDEMAVWKQKQHAIDSALKDFHRRKVFKEALDDAHRRREARQKEKRKMENEIPETPAPTETPTETTVVIPLADEVSEVKEVSVVMQSTLTITAKGKPEDGAKIAQALAEAVSALGYKLPTQPPAPETP